MRCENCQADVPKVYDGSDGRKYCCQHCLFNPLGCRCKYGEIGVAEDRFYGDGEDEEDYDDDDFDQIETPDYLRTCADCHRLEESCICGELPPEAKHDDDCPCSCCQTVKR